MSKTLNKKRSILLSEGLDISKPAEYLSDIASPSNQNFKLDRNILTKRSGSSVFGAIIGGTQTEIMAGRELIREGSRYNVRIGLDKIERYDGGTSAWVDITGTDLTGSTTDLVDTAVPLLSGKAILCITNGIDAIRKWTATGNTADLGGTPPIAKFIQDYKTYLVCANIQGGTDIAQRVQWSDTADPETWDAGNAGAVDLVEDGEDITGLGLFGDYLCVHKKNSIYLGSLVSSNDIFRFDRRSVEKGAIANATIVNIPTGEQIFLAEDGLRLFNGVSAPLVDSKINDEIRDGLNQQYAQKSWGCLVSEQDEVWIGIPIGSQTTGDTVYKYNYNTGVIYKDIRSNITCAWRALQTSDISWDNMVGTWDAYSGRWNDSYLNTNFANIYLGLNTGYVHKIDNTLTNDGASAINSFWESRDFISDDVGQLCRWLELHLWAKGSSVTVEYSIDGGTTWASPDGSPFTLDDEFPSDSSPDIFYFDVFASRIRFRFSNNVVSENLAIKQFMVGYKPREFMGA